MMPSIRVKHEVSEWDHDVSDDNKVTWTRPRYMCIYDERENQARLKGELRNELRLDEEVRSEDLQKRLSHDKYNIDYGKLLLQEARFALVD
jgi:hypothetical protein